ncbi:hypothetical protein [Mycobacterium dioxanotrophicus]|uniref:hypothetical protein n=1 Tax=Mycobacterium dioxanotrophicus TaxID=482462 RepID=UPI0012FBB978|nr:hypothetical protein [Mycobacterium dioxanotrophicus]
MRLWAAFTGWLYRARHRGTCLVCGQVLRDDVTDELCSPACEETWLRAGAW